MSIRPTASRVFRVLSICVLLSAVFGTSSAFAQLPGSLYGSIFDENGDPVVGAHLLAVDPEQADNRAEATTDKRGRYKLFFKNAIVPYTLTIKADGFATLTFNGVKISARKDTRRNFDMRTAAAAAQAVADVDPEAAARGGAVKSYNGGVQALNNGDVDTAEMLFTAALEKDGELLAAKGGLARVYNQRGDHSKAVELAEQVLAADEDVEAMNQILYSSYTALGEKKKAKAALEVLQEADPEKASKNMFNEAAEHYNNGRMEEARAGLEQVVNVDPNNGKAFYMLGLVYISGGENDKAKESLEKFLALAPNDPDAATAKEMLSYLE